MSETGGAFLAEQALVPLAKFYDRENLEEIVMNRFEKVVVKLKGGGWIEEDAPDLTYERLSRMCKILANINGSRFSETELPVVSCQIPGKPLRFQAVLGGNILYSIGDQRGVALSIRSLRAQEMGFERWGLTPESQLKGSASFVDEFVGLSDHIEKIKRVIALHQSLIVSGATSTGKTTFTNGIIKLIHPNARIITVEDVPELTVEQHNRVRMIVQRNQGTNRFGWVQAVDSLMRLTPDWVVCGELSVANASTVYNLMGKGHPVLTTVHSNTPEEALQAFITNMSADGSTLSGDNTLEQLQSRVGCIIQLDRRNNQRLVTDITFPSTDRTRELQLKEAAKQIEMRKIAGEAGFSF